MKERTSAKRKSNQKAPKVQGLVKPIGYEQTVNGRRDNLKTYNNGLFDFFSETDPNGSYTGVPLDSDTKPVQDVDDL